MKLKPLGDRVVLKKLNAEKTTASGIIMTGGAKEKPDYAEIVALSDSLLADSELSLGDKVIYAQYKGTSVTDGDDEYIVIDLDEIMAIVEE